ncbi:alpha-D-ribose 1-methylphosphonate 5-phosphate C-P-lyase PhnJ [Corynebacterium doosanense]|uniref:alpha-D-ribose 1-methylphosphonate 5-phosphate C-P-lyase PhnJ n=1 Tax=Corynebacterium doosanense TaxID=1121358 RepID=UPI000366CF0D|nr:alpha-D-ribose 1-methylphosphonate 5-phosphate C-P-lyase PhnJ [Corynebacterium doosanense]
MSIPTVAGLSAAAADRAAANVGVTILDEQAKREVRRAILAGVAIPGYQVPFGSREMPVARGWGSGGLQATLSIAGAEDTVKVIDQGDEEGVNAVNLRRLILGSLRCRASADTRESTLIQSRHRIPEDSLSGDQIVVLQVPVSEPLRDVVKSIREANRMHAEADYSRMWVSMYEDLVTSGVINKSSGYPVVVNHRHVMALSPIPRWDVPRLNDAKNLAVLSHGRDKKIYCVLPHTPVEPVAFDDVPFEVEHTEGETCVLCGSADTYLVPTADGRHQCSDTEWCSRVRAGDVDPEEHLAVAPRRYYPDPERRVGAIAEPWLTDSALLTTSGSEGHEPRTATGGAVEPQGRVPGQDLPGPPGLLGGDGGRGREFRRRSG